MSNNKNLRPIFAPPHDVVTGNQMNVLLGAMQTIHRCLVGFDEYEEEEHKGAADGGCKMAAETTFIKLCQRVDSLLEDSTRWSMKGQETLEEDLSKLFKTQEQASRVHALAMAKSLEPAVKHGALLYKIDSETFAAYTGDLRDPNDSILALGQCPEEAMQNYNMVCYGKMSERAHQDLFTEVLRRLGKERSQIDEKKMVPGGDSALGRDAETLDFGGGGETAEEDAEGAPEEAGEEPPGLPPTSSFPPSC